MHFATGLRFSRVLRPPCLGVIHEIIHSLRSRIVFLINYHLFSSLSLHAVGSAVVGVDDVSWAHQLPPRGTRLPPRLPAVMDGFTSSQAQARNAPAASFKMMLDRHVKPDGWWQSVAAGVGGLWFAATHDGGWSKLLVAFL